MFFNKANIKVYIAGFVYTILISTVCYFVKLHDGISASSETRYTLLDPGNINTVTQAAAINTRKIAGNNLSLKYTIKHQNETKPMIAKEEIEESIANNIYIEDEVFWSREIEMLLPKGKTEEEYHSFLNAVDTQQVRVAEKAAKNKCAKASVSRNNKYIELDNGMKLCARNKRYLEGEVLSFYIARLLGLDNVPPVKMVLYTRNSYLWKNVNNQTTMNTWKEESVITLSQWIEGLEGGIPIPKVLLKCLNESTTFTSRNKLLCDIAPVEILDLVQMSDLIIFDFIVHHSDRIRINKIQHNRSTKDHLYLWSPIHNLGIEKHNQQNQIPINKFWLIDNEATNARTISFNEEMMKTMCIFRRSTIENIKLVLEDGNPYRTLFTEISKHDRVFWEFWHQHRKDTSIQVFNHRLLGQMTKVLRWVSECQLKMQS